MYLYDYERSDVQSAGTMDGDRIIEYIRKQSYLAAPNEVVAFDLIAVLLCGNMGEITNRLPRRYVEIRLMAAINAEGDLAQFVTAPILGPYKTAKNGRPIRSVSIINLHRISLQFDEQQRKLHL